MNWQLSSSVQLIISDLNEIAADAYRHRIRPTDRKGGSGAYDGSNGGRPYSLPAKYQSNRRARFTLTSVSPDAIEIQAVSSEDTSWSIKAIIDCRGRLRNIASPFLPPLPRPSDAGPSTLSPAGEVVLPLKAFPKLFDEEA